MTYGQAEAIVAYAERRQTYLDLQSKEAKRLVAEIEAGREV